MGTARDLWRTHPRQTSARSRKKRIFVSDALSTPTPTRITLSTTNTKAATAQEKRRTQTSKDSSKSTQTTPSLSSSLTRHSEHLRRVHSLRFWCSQCYHKFNITSDNANEVLKSNHESSCRPDPTTLTMEKRDFIHHLLMTVEQDTAWQNWKSLIVPLPPQKGKVKERKAYHTWRKIYASLYPGVAIPDSTLKEVEDDSTSTNGSHTTSSLKGSSPSTGTEESDGSSSPEAPSRPTNAASLPYPTPMQVIPSSYLDLRTQHATIPDNTAFYNHYPNMQQTIPLEKIQQGFHPEPYDISIGTPSMTSFEGSNFSMDTSLDVVNNVNIPCFDHGSAPMISEHSFPIYTAHDFANSGPQRLYNDPYEIMLDAELQLIGQKDL